MNRAPLLTIAITALIFGSQPAFAAELKDAPAAQQVKPGDHITEKNAPKVADLVSPGNYVLVRQGMEMNVVAAKDYNWPAPFWSSTEQYSPQVRLGPNGELTNYLAGLPFPMIDANDPQVAQKIMWNFQFGPAYSDDLDSQDAEIQNFAPGHPGDPFAVYPIGHLAVYRNLGREEVAPAPTDYDGDTGIMERMAVGPIMVPIEPPFWQNPWTYFVRYRYSNPNRSDLVWSGTSLSRWLGEFRGMDNSSYLLGNAFFGNLDLDSLFGFAGKFQDFSFKFLGERDILAVVHAKSLPPNPARPMAAVRSARKIGRCATFM